MSTISLLTKQTEAWDAYENPIVTEIGYGGAAGGGKTRIGWYLFIDICEGYFNAECVVGRKELKTLRLTTLKELWIIFEELGYVKDRDYKYNASDSIITFLSTGSNITLLDMAYSPQDENYTRFGSLPVTAAWIDESNESPDKAVSIIKIRVGRANKLYKVIKNADGTLSKSKERVEVKPLWVETFNPNKGRVYRTYYKPWKDGKLPSYRVFIPALPGDNHHLTEAYIDNLRRSDPITRERMLKGNFEFDDDPQKIIDYNCIMNLTDNVLGPTTKLLPDGNVVHDVLKDNSKYLIADIARFGGDKIVFGVFKNRLLYRLEAYTYQGIDESIRIAKQICLEEQIPYANVLADEDGVGGGFVDGMKGTKGFHGNASPTTVWDALKAKKIPANYRNMRSQCYFMLAEGINNAQFAVRITTFNTNILEYTLEQALLDMFEELDAVKKTDDSDESKKAIIPKEDIKAAIGRSPDFSDILMMRVYFDLLDMPQDDVIYISSRNTNSTVRNKAR